MHYRLRSFFSNAAWRWLRTRRSFILLISLCCFSAWLTLAFVHHPAVLAQTQPAQAQQTEEQTEVDRLFDQCYQLVSRGSSQEALQACQQALEAARAVGDRAGEARSLGNLGVVYRSLGQYQQAIEHYQQALQISRTIGDQTIEAKVLNSLGNISYTLRQYQQALEYNTQVLQIKREIGDRNGEADSLNALGNVSYALEQYPQAIDYYNRSLQIAQEIGDRAGEANALGNLGNVSADVEQYQQATEYYTQALQIFQEIGNRAEEAATLGNLGLVSAVLKQYPQASDYYTQALQVQQEIGDRAREAATLSNLGLVSTVLGQYPQTIDYHTQALRIQQAIDDRNGEADSLNALGNVSYDLGQYPQAIDYYNQALQIRQEMGDRAEEANLLHNLGLVFYSLGQYPKAIEYCRQALQIQQQMGDRQTEARSLGSLGVIFHALGQYPQAIEYHSQALQIRREIGDREGESNSLVNFGIVSTTLGQYPQAIEYYRQAFEIQQQMGDRKGEATVLDSVGTISRALGQYPQAIEYHSQALQIRREIGDREGEAVSLGSLGHVSHELGQYPQATEYYTQALQIQQEIGDRNGEAVSLASLGAVSKELGQYPQAIDYLTQALQIQQEIGDRAGEASSLNNLGYTLFETGELGQAEQTLHDSITVFEQLRPGLEDADKLSLFETLTSPYFSLQQVLVAQGREAEALEVAERGRARAFVELLTQRLVPTEAQAEAIAQVTQALDLAAIQQVARTQNATLVEYALARESQLYIWVVAPTGTIDFRSVDLSELESTLTALATTTNAELDQSVRQTSRALALLVESTRQSIGVAPVTRSNDPNTPNPLPAIPADDPRLAQGLKQLHHLLIAPIAELLPTDPIEQIIFIPQDRLFLVPFAALQDAEGTYLIQQHTLRIAPSIQVLALTQQQQRQASANQSLLVVGNPTEDLDHAEREATDVAQFLGTTALIGAQATEPVVTERMAEARLIHLATHGKIDRNDSTYWGSVSLAPTAGADGLLTTSEVLELQLQAELVVLSGCNTGVGDINSDGVIGLTRSLITAGTPSVIASLWQVPDASTATLMLEFYRHWQPELHQSRQWQVPPLMVGWMVPGMVWMFKRRSSRYRRNHRAAMRRWIVPLALLVLISVVTIAHSASSQPAPAMDKAQALRQAMLTTMQEYPEPGSWAAFTLIGEAQ